MWYAICLHDIVGVIKNIKSNRHTPHGLEINVCCWNLPTEVAEQQVCMFAVAQIASLVQKPVAKLGKVSQHLAFV
jgi:hypothetical protein